MPIEPRDAVELDAFAPALAQAVEAVLRREGLPARTQAAAGDWAVLVPDGRRDEAFALLARHMDEVQALARGQPAPPAADPDDADGPPIVMERLRRMGFLALLLAPLLVVTLASAGMPLRYALALFLLGVVVVAAWRDRAAGD
ncbi:MAG TPA: hypothetical protein VG452_09090 [Egibacteraceae bacterium]|nr:hypothetical protein [Egibacteraceae bacterium]